MATESAEASPERTAMAGPEGWSPGLCCAVPDSQPDTEAAPEFASSHPGAPCLGPSLGPGETLPWESSTANGPCADPAASSPATSFCRIGRRGQNGTLRAPFPDGLATVRQSIRRRTASDEAVLLQVLRGSSKLELPGASAKGVPRLLTPASAAVSSAGVRRCVGPGFPRGRGEEHPEAEWCWQRGGTASSPLWPRAQSTTSWASERLKAYGFALDLPLPSPSAREQGLGQLPGAGKSERRPRRPWQWLRQRSRRGCGMEDVRPCPQEGCLGT